MQQFLWKHLTKCNSKNAIIMSAYLLHAYCYVPNITGIKRDLTHGFFSWKKQNKIILSSYRMWEYEISVRVNKWVQCHTFAPCTHFLWFSARIQGQGWVIPPDCPSWRSCSQGYSLSNQNLTNFGFLNGLIVSNCFIQVGWEQACFKEEVGMHRRRVESVEDKLYNFTVLHLGLISEVLGLTTTHTVSCKLWFYRAFTCIRCDHGHPHA